MGKFLAIEKDYDRKRILYLLKARVAVFACVKYFSHFADLHKIFADTINYNIHVNRPRYNIAKTKATTLKNTECNGKIKWTRSFVCNSNVQI